MAMSAYRDGLPRHFFWTLSMNRLVQVERAHAFRAMHDRSRVLLLPNAWDAGSARLLSRRGFAAIATTSGGMAWSLGYADGECAPLDEVVAAVGRITRVVDGPVTVDLESGYGPTPEHVAVAVGAVIGAGAAGINLEDGMPGHGPLRRVEEAAERIRAAREAAGVAGVPIVINARVDNWMQHDDIDAQARFADAVVRGKAYIAAGADCIFPIGLTDSATLTSLVEALDAPVNVAAGPATPGLAELSRLGVARVSTATRLATLALGAMEQAALAMREQGCFDGLAAHFTYGDAQALFEPV